MVVAGQHSSVSRPRCRQAGCGGVGGAGRLRKGRQVWFCKFCCFCVPPDHISQQQGWYYSCVAGCQGQSHSSWLAAGGCGLRAAGHLQAAGLLGHAAFACTLAPRIRMRAVSRSAGGGVRGCCLRSATACFLCKLGWAATLNVPHALTPPWLRDKCRGCVTAAGSSGSSRVACMSYFQQLPASSAVMACLPPSTTLLLPAPCFIITCVVMLWMPCILLWQPYRQPASLHMCSFILCVKHWAAAWPTVRG